MVSFVAARPRERGGLRGQSRGAHVRESIIERSIAATSASTAPSNGCNLKIPHRFAAIAHEEVIVTDFPGRHEALAQGKMSLEHL